MPLSVDKKLAILADAAKYDASCASSGSNTQRKGKGVGSTEGMGICHSYTPDGRCVSLLKILMTNYCIYDCKFCINRVSSSVKRARFSVNEVVNLTLEFYKRNYIEGLFLSSGIIRNGEYTMEQMVAIANKLRIDHGYKGYIHLKAIPGASKELLEDAGRYADRLSINVELPTEGDLEALAPEKDRKLLENDMQVIKFKIDETKDAQKARLRPPAFSPAGQSTQMIVGATPTTDRTIMTNAANLYQKHQLRRVYYSAFSPIPDSHSNLPLVQPPLLREHRLYQTDWLLRFYGFNVNEVLPDSDPELRLDIDPKLSWALRNADFFPLDVNKASKKALLRIPGMGPRTVDKIIRERRVHKIRLDHLKQLRCSVKKIKPFIVTCDYWPEKEACERQMIALVEPETKQLALAL